MYTFYQTGGVRECWNCCCGGCDTSRLCTCDIAQFNVFRPGGEEANAVPGNGSMDRVACMMKSKEYEPSGARFVNPADGKGLVANLLDLGKDLSRGRSIPTPTTTCSSSPTTPCRTRPLSSPARCCTTTSPTRRWSALSTYF